jgi:hypothetical protein
MIHRSGATLVEVLVAIFIMAIGLMTLLTLFPLGALSMAQAIRDDRSAQAAANAAAIAEARNVRNDLLVYNTLDLPDRTQYPDLSLTPDGPSYPVYIDPFGMQVDTTRRLGRSAPSPGITRENVSFVGSNYRQLFRWFSLQDDITFGKSDTGGGLPASTTVERAGRYSWAYMVKRPRYSDRSVVDLSVVVFEGRTSVLPLADQQYVYSPVKFDETSNFVSFNYGANKPPIRKGTWILDATVVKPRSGNPSLLPDPHGYFYRVVGVTEAGTDMTLELQTNPRVSTFNAQYPGGWGVLVFMENAVEVFEKGPGWRPLTSP